MEKIKEFFIRIFKFIKNIFIPEQIEIDGGILVSPPKSATPYVTIAFLFVLYFAVQATNFSLVVLFQKLFGFQILLTLLLVKA